MMEPLSVCVNAAIRADVKMGDNVIVFGAGPIGLMTLQVARASGASSVCVTGSSGRANSRHWFTTSFLQPLPYLVTP